MRSTTVKVALACAAILAMLALGASTAQAQTCTVGAGGTYATIQAAIVVSTCATINVAAGTYRETLEIKRPLTINGADGAVLDGSTLGLQKVGVKIKSGDVTFDNVDVEHFSGNGIIVGYEASIPGSLKNVHITNCRISGIQPGYSHGFGIYVGYQSEDFKRPTPPKLTAHLDYSGLLIENNEVTDSRSSSVVLQSITGDPGTLVVRNNYIHDNDNDGIWIDSARNINIEGNLIRNNPDGIYISSYGDAFQGVIGGEWIYDWDNQQLNGPYGPKNLQITGNQIVGNVAYGGVYLGAGYPALISIHENIITGNGPGVGNYLTEVVSATNNWWGDASGPSGAGSGTGDSVSAYVVFDPWRTGGIPALVNVSKLLPSWTGAGGGGVYSAYFGPPDYALPGVSPGATAVYDGREAGIIKAGLALDADGHYWDDGIFGFKPTVTIDEFAATTLTYDVVNQYGENPVWMTIEIDTGFVGDRTDNTVYQFVPTTNPASWHTVDAATGRWQKWADNQGTVTGPLMLLSGIARAHTGLYVVRTYLRLGMGDSYHGIGALGTVAWVDKATLGGVTYDFVVDITPPVVTTSLDITVEATGADGALVNFADATAIDDIDGTITPVVCLPSSGSIFPLGLTTVTCTATDSSDNDGSASFTVTVSDTTPPILSVPASPITKEATSSAGAVVTFTTSAIDIVDPAPAVLCAPLSGATFAIGTTLVNCTARDAAANESAAQAFNVIVTAAALPKKYVVTVSSSTPVVGSTVTINAQLANWAGTPVALQGVKVSWSKTLGAGGYLKALSSVTNASGKASVSFTTGTTPGVGYTVTATDTASRTGTSLLFTTVIGTLHDLALSPLTATVAVNVGQAYTVTGFDKYNNSLGAVTGTSFAIAGGSCSGNVCRSTVAGNHTVTGTKGTAKGTATLTVTAGSAEHLAFGKQPTGTRVNTAISPAVTVKILDLYGNLVDISAPTTIAVDLGSNPTGATLSGTLTVEAVHGVATFSNLKLDKTGRAYTLTASSGSLFGATSARFDVTR